MLENKLEFYNRATRELMEYASEDYPDVMVGKYPLSYAVAALREAYKHPITYKNVFGLETFKRYYPTQTDPSQDYCLVTSYYLYLRSGGSAIWSIKNTHPHVWLQSPTNCEPFDITYTQFVSAHQRPTMNYGKFMQQFPYHKGRVDDRIEKDPNSVADIIASAITLGKCAGLE